MWFFCVRIRVSFTDATEWIYQMISSWLSTATATEGKECEEKQEEEEKRTSSTEVALVYPPWLYSSSYSLTNTIFPRLSSSSTRIMESVKNAVNTLLGRKPTGPKVRYGVVAAGWISQSSFMPGIGQTSNSGIGSAYEERDIVRVELYSRNDRLDQWWCRESVIN